MTATTAKPTPGPWYVCGDFTPHYKAITSPDGYIVFSFADPAYDNEHGAPFKAPSVDAQQANARLIAEAGTVYHETGLTPRQLADRCAELEKALVSVVSTYDSYRRRGVNPAPAEYADVVRSIDTIARAALARKVTP